MKLWKKHVLQLAMVLVIITAVAAASAAPSQTFDALLTEYGLDTSSPQTIAHTYAAKQSVQTLGVSIALEGLYYDGDQLLIGWRTDNLQPEQPALVLYTSTRIGGILVDADADYPLSLWWPQAFGLFVTGDPINGLMNGFYSASAKDFLLQGTQEVAVTFTVKRPTKPLVVVDADIFTPYDDADTETDRQSMLAAMEAAGVTVAPLDQQDVQAWADKGYLAVNGAGEFLNANGTTDDMAALNGEDLTDADTADITMTFMVDFSALAGK